MCPQQGHLCNRRRAPDRSLVKSLASFNSDTRIPLYYSQLVMDKAYFSDYTRLLAKVDTFCARLKMVHAPQLLCRRGCCDCCKQDLHLLPLEFHFIGQGLTDRFGKAFNHQRRRPDIHQNSCLLLGNGDCQLYEHRPIICRSHGLPLLITQEDQTWRDCCPKNFPTQPLNEFPESGLLHLERLNTILIMLNKRFCSRTGLDPAKRKSISSLPNPEHQTF